MRPDTRIAVAIVAVGVAVALPAALLAAAAAAGGLAPPLLLLCVLVLLGALVGGAFSLTAHLTRDARALARRARAITEGDLGVGAPRGPADVAAGPDRGKGELADVARALDLLEQEARRRLSSEQRFTADVAHELRTPLTGLVTAAELLPPGRPTELVRDRVAKLRTLVEDLLEVSRLDARVETADLKPCELGHLVRHIVSNAMPEAELEVFGDARVLTEPRRVDRVITNLLVNARRHGTAPFVVTVQGPVVTVRDHGPGFPDDLLVNGPRRFRTGKRERGSGHGLGLTIAAGQADVIGTVLHFTNHPEGGAQVILDLTSRRVG